jgi:hypothetical protein
VRSRGPERPEKVIGWSGCRITDETADAYDEVIGAIDNARLPFLPDSIPPSSGDDGSGGEDHDDDPGDGKDKPKSAAAAAKPSNVAVPPARRLLEQGHRPSARVHARPSRNRANACETQAMVIRPAPRDQVPVGIIEVEEPLQLARRQLTGEPAVRGDLLIRQKLHRHESRP